MKNFHKIIGTAMTLIIMFSALFLFVNSYGQVWDKWIEKSDTVKVYSPVTINGKEYFGERALYDGTDYVLVVHRITGNTVIYVDKKSWYEIGRGQWLFYKKFTAYDRTYGRIYKRY